VHDVKADAPKRRVFKSLGNGPNDVKPKFPPKSHGDVVRFHNRVELHRSASLLTSPRERVLAERTSHPPAPRIAGYHEARGCKRSPRATRSQPAPAEAFTSSPAFPHLLAPSICLHHDLLSKLNSTV
jgi:hypothetical protein